MSFFINTYNSYLTSLLSKDLWQFIEIILCWTLYTVWSICNGYDAGLAELPPIFRWLPLHWHIRYCMSYKGNAQHNISITNHMVIRCHNQHYQQQTQVNPDANMKQTQHLPLPPPISVNSITHSNCETWLWTDGWRNEHKLKCRLIW